MGGEFGEKGAGAGYIKDAKKLALKRKHLSWSLREEPTVESKGVQKEPKVVIAWWTHA